MSGGQHRNDRSQNHFRKEYRIAVNRKPTAIKSAGDSLRLNHLYPNARPTRNDAIANQVI
jgi:hypothetical protein